MPPRFVIPALLAATFLGTALASLFPPVPALALTAGLSLGAVAALQKPIVLVLGVIGICAAFRVALLAAENPPLTAGTQLVVSGTVSGVRTEPTALLRLTQPVELSGKRVQFVSPIDRAVAPGDRVSGTCVVGHLKGPGRRWRINGVVANCLRFSATSIQSGSGIARLLSHMRTSVAQKIRALYVEPGSDFLEGILVGAPPNGSAELTAILRTAGVSHLVAVSGYNLTVLVGVLGAVILPLFGRRWGSALLVLGLVLFAGVAGFEASVLRAGAMATLQVGAYLVGRPAALPRLLALSVLVLIVAAPGLLLFDLGFQLSVAATAGIAALAGPLERRLELLPEALGLRTALATSFAAVIATAPVLMVTVGRVSLMAPLTTAILSPMIPPAMALGASSVALASVLPALAAPVVAVEQVLLDSMLGVARLAAGVPFASVAVPWTVGLGLLSSLLLARALRRRTGPVLPGWEHHP